MHEPRPQSSGTAVVAAPTGLRKWLLPSPNDLTFLVVFVAALTLGNVLTSRDGDLGRHLRIAEWMLENRELPLTDIFSYTAAGTPVVVHEWLAQLALGVAHRLGGFNGVGLLAATLVAAPWAMICRSLLRRGFPVSLTTTLSILGAVTSVVHWAARPHVFTFVFFAYWVIALSDYEAGRRSSLWLLPLLTAFWANIHGAFIVGFVLVGMYWLAAIVDRRAAHVRHLTVVLVSSVAASLANPNGAGLIVNSFGYLGEEFLVTFTTEYNSPNFHLRGFWPFLLMITIGLVLSVPHRTSARIVFLGWTAFALYSFRNIPLFALAAVPLLAEQVDDKLQANPAFAAGPRTWLAARGRGWSDLNAKVVGGTLSLAVVIVVAVAWGPAERDSRFFFDTDRFPVATMDAIGEARPGEAIFNQFAWGGYLLYCCWPEIDVFIDGQTDFYGAELTKEYHETINGAPAWSTVLDKYEVDWVLIEPEMPLAQLLTESTVWEEVMRDPTAVVFVRSNESIALSPR